MVTLARSVRARTGAAEGAAVRDTDGRTYAACHREPAVADADRAAGRGGRGRGQRGRRPGGRRCGDASREVDADSLAAVRDSAPRCPCSVPTPPARCSRPCGECACATIIV